MAKRTPMSAMTVSVRGIPMSAKHIQKILPDVVTGTIFPYPEGKINIHKCDERRS